MISAFLPLIALAYGTSQVEGWLALFPRASGLLWLWATACFLGWWLPCWAARRAAEREPPSFLTTQTAFQWGVAIWISLLHATAIPARLLSPALCRLLPQAWPLGLSVTAYIVILWTSRQSFHRVFHLLLDPDQTPEEYFRARMTLPILFFPPMLLWMTVEDLFISHQEIAGLGDLQAFILAPLFFVGLYLFSPRLFNWAWRADPMEDTPLRRSIFQLAAAAEAPITGVKLWDTFKEPLPNAAVAGLSDRYRFVYMTRYLLELFPERQLLAVVAHELGHLRLGHVWTYLLFSLDLVFLSVLVKLEVFFRIPWLAEQYETYGSTIDIVLFLGIFLLFFTALTRHSEVQADRFAASLVGGNTFAETMETLQEFIHPPDSRIPKWVMSHPDFPDRIRDARQWVGNIGQLVVAARRVRWFLLVVGLGLLLLGLPSGHQLWHLGNAARLLDARQPAAAADHLRQLPARLLDHPEIRKWQGRIALANGQWVSVLRTAAGLYGKEPGWFPPVRSEEFEHAAPPEVAFHFQVMEFLLEALDLRRVHGVSLFDEALDQIQIPLGQ